MEGHGINPFQSENVRESLYCGRINHNLEQQAQAIFKSWFVNFKPWGGVMPASWPIAPLEELCSLIAKGITPQYDAISSEVVINQKCIRNKEINMNLARRHKPKRITEKWLQYGDILINSTGEGTLGRAAQFFLTNPNITVDSHVTIVRPKEKHLLYFLGQWCLQRENDFVAMSSGSTGQTDLPRERLKAMKCFCPDENTLSIFSDVVKPLIEKQLSFQRESSYLAALRDALLPKLMSGEIDVSDISIS